MKAMDVFSLFRRQRYAVMVLLVLIAGVLAFRGWRQSAPEEEPEQPYEQFRAEIEAFESQLTAKTPVPKKSKKTKALKRPKSPAVVQPKVQSMQAIEETVGEEIPPVQPESRRIVPMEAE